MNANQMIADYIRDNSKLDQHRPYIGMSNAGNCPLAIYRAYTNGITLNDKAFRNSFRGYKMEETAKQILIGSGIMKPNSERHLQAVNQPLIQGNTDGETVHGDLLEIKSMSLDKFNAVVADNKLPNREYRQVQAYMHYGYYQKALVFVICPETFDTHTLWVTPNRYVIDQIVKNFATVLAAIQINKAPTCTCSRCK